MPGEISRSNPGPRDAAPYVPSWNYRSGPKMCPCGHHEGYHNDAGECVNKAACGCKGIPAASVTPLDEI